MQMIGDAHMQSSSTPDSALDSLPVAGGSPMMSSPSQKTPLPSGSFPSSMPDGHGVEPLGGVQPATSCTAGVAAAPEATATVSSTVPDYASSEQHARQLSRIHILPFSDENSLLQGRSRLDCIAPTLKQFRKQRKVLQAGDLVINEDVTFAIVKCDPPEGPLGFETDFYLDGNPLLRFDKIQFSAWGPSTEMSSEELFQHCITPFFEGEYAPFRSDASKRVRLLHHKQVLQMGEFYVQVDATEPVGLGVVTPQTEIFAVWDQTPEFDKVHIVPFQDTLPRAYEYDIFFDYLRPFLLANRHKKFQRNELFSYHGVQFKVVACEPNVCARIGKATTIYSEGQLHPSLRNLLPPEVLQQVAQLPPDMQQLLLRSERTTREVEEMLTQSRGLFRETLNQIEKIRWPPADSSVTQATCMVCLCDFQIADECRRLPCNHVFHTACVDEWLLRCTDCPLCKMNVDRALRHY